jgi:hypothetical protein
LNVRFLVVFHVPGVPAAVGGMKFAIGANAQSAWLEALEMSLPFYLALLAVRQQRQCAGELLASYIRSTT